MVINFLIILFDYWFTAAKIHQKNEFTYKKCIILFAKRNKQEKSGLSQARTLKTM